MMNLSLTDLMEALENIQNSAPRKWVVMTGERGMENFDHMLEVQNLKDYVIFLKDSDIITEKQQKNLHNMIDSSDWENFHLAKAIIHNIKPTQTPTQDVSNLQSQGPQV